MRTHWINVDDFHDHSVCGRTPEHTNPCSSDLSKVTCADCLQEAISWGCCRYCECDKCCAFREEGL